MIKSYSILLSRCLENKVELARLDLCQIIKSDCLIVGELSKLGTY